MGPRWLYAAGSRRRLAGVRNVTPPTAPTGPLPPGVLEVLGPLRGRRLLVVGTGAAGMARVGADLGAVVSLVDVSTSRLAAARRWLPTADLRLAASHELPYDNRTFDVVCSVDPTIGDVDFPRLVCELARVTGTGGRVVLAVPTAGGLDEAFSQAGLVIVHRLVSPPMVVAVTLERPVVGGHTG